MIKDARSLRKEADDEQLAGCVGLMMSMMGTGLAQESETAGGMPLMQALKARYSTCEFGSQPLPAG